MTNTEGRANSMSGPIAFVRLAEDTYPRSLEVIADRERFTDSYGDRRRIAQRRFDDFRARGFDPVKVPVDPDEMLAWCRAKGRAVDSNGRAAFANFKLAEGYGRGAR
jgi:hypothetical protein